MNIKDVINNPYFQKHALQKGEILFDEGDIDKNLYIIISGNLKIEKYIGKEKTEKKLLATLGKDEIFGEGALSNKKPKEVSIKADKNTELLKISSREFESFLRDFPKLGIKILGTIIDVSNKRLLESNYLLTTSYHISKIISEKTEFNNKNLFEIIDNILKVLDLEYILVFEKNPILENYIKFSYDSRIKGKMQDSIFESNTNIHIDFLQENNISVEKNSFIQELINQNKNIGYLVFSAKEKVFSNTLKKTIHSISILIAGFIKQKQYLEDEKNKS